MKVFLSCLSQEKQQDLIDIVGKRKVDVLQNMAQENHEKKIDDFNNAQLASVTSLFEMFKKTFYAKVFIKIVGIAINICFEIDEI